MSYLREFPEANMQDFLYAANHEAPLLFVEVGRSLLTCKSQLTHKEREMLGVYCLSLNNALQPIHVHSRNFVALGGERWLIQDLVRDKSFSSIDAKFHPLFNIIRKATLLVQSEPLPLTQVPIDEKISGDRVLLERADLYLRNLQYLIQGHFFEMNARKHRSLDHVQ